jgi:IMP dehydrogenase
MTHSDIPLALTFDDVLLVPQYSEVMPGAVDPSTELVPGLRLAAPLVSSAMDTVTESRLAIAMARAGGLSFIHKNLSIEAQADEIRAVKAWRPEAAEVRPDGATCDAHGRLSVGAAVGVGADRDARLTALVHAGVDIVVIDTAHGHTESVLSAVTATRAKFPGLRLVAGNVATAAATQALIDAGAEAIKVGIGPGSICTTRIVAGVGVPQVSAILDCATIAGPRGVPLIADGGVRYSGDIVKALAAGAATVMIGSLFAGTPEAPGEIIKRQGKQLKRYRGMGSLGAMQNGSADRYFQSGTQKLVPEGVEGLVAVGADLGSVVFQLVGGLRAGMGYLGAANLAALRARAHFLRVTSAGMQESHVHDLVAIDEAPNYRGRS